MCVRALCAEHVCSVWEVGERRLIIAQKVVCPCVLRVCVCVCVCVRVRVRAPGCVRASVACTRAGRKWTYAKQIKKLRYLSDGVVVF